MHLGSLESTKEAWELLGAQPRATLASWVLSKLPKCIHNSIYAQLKSWTNSFVTWRQQLCSLNIHIRESATSRLINCEMFVWIYKETMISRFIKSILKSLVVPAIWLAQIGAICNGNRTEWSPIRSVIIRVITKSDDRAAGVRFVYREYDYRQNWTTRSLITN